VTILRRPYLIEEKGTITVKEAFESLHRAHDKLFSEGFAQEAHDLDLAIICLREAMFGGRKLD
jgi:hypothetical protein